MTPSLSTEANSNSSYKHIPEIPSPAPKHTPGIPSLFADVNSTSASKRTSSETPSLSTDIDYTAAPKPTHTD